MLRTRLRAGGLAAVILSMIFAVGFVFVANVELFFPGLRFQAGRPAPVTIRIPYASIFTLTETQVELTHRGLVVPRGQIARNAEVVAQVEAFERSRRPPTERPGVYIGLFLLYVIIGLLLSSQLRRLGSRGALLRTQVATFILLLLGMVFAKSFLLFTPLPEFYLPVAALPLWKALYVDRRAATLVAPAVALLASSLLGFDMALVAVLLAQGLVAVAALRDPRHPREVVGACIKASLVAGAVYVCIMLVFEGRFHLVGDLSRLHMSGVLASIGGGLAAAILAFALAPVAALMLGGVSRSRLLELAELDQPLLRKLALEAPGSFAHARAMANFAETAAQAIKADALLVRVGAYYHDLGKTVQPDYFIENVKPDEASPHEDLDPHVSADAIMAHVVEGTKILREGGIPEPVVEFAYTHHGTSVVEYFWTKCLAQGNPGGLSIEQFRYPGMKPQTRETAILMIVDAIEATSRTIDPPSREGFEQAIYRTVYSKLRQGQLDESGMTLEDLHRVCDTLCEALTTAGHARIPYPWQVREAQEAAARRTAEARADLTPVAEAELAVATAPTVLAEPEAPAPAPAGPNGAARGDGSGVQSVGADPSPEPPPVAAEPRVSGKQ